MTIDGNVLGTEIVGADFGLRGVMGKIRHVAPIDSPVILLGETGTGKDVIANCIHAFSPRREKPFIRVNCGAIPDSIIDSELFGHEKGAFTGAISQKRGRFERAQGGTVFLDEIGELSPRAQVRLLHVIQNREIERVGGAKPIPVDVRIISATHRNLEEMVAASQFREDVWFRLNVFPILIPPLRDRKKDIPALVNHFIPKKCAALEIRKIPGLEPDAMDMLLAHDWPGNVRELENIVERALIYHRGEQVCFKGLIGSRQEPAERPGPLGEIKAEGGADSMRLDDVIARHIRQVMLKTRGRINGHGGAAELLGLHPNTLRKKMDRLNIPYGRGATDWAGR